VEGSFNDKSKQGEGIYILPFMTILLSVQASFLFQLKICF